MYYQLIVHRIISFQFQENFLPKVLMDVLKIHLHHVQRLKLHSYPTTTTSTKTTLQMFSISSDRSDKFILALLVMLITSMNVAHILFNIKNQLLNLCVIVLIYSFFLSFFFLLSFLSLLSATFYESGTCLVFSS